MAADAGELAPSSAHRRERGQLRRALGQVFANARIRRVELAWIGFSGAESATWVAMLVYAYGRGGATEAGLVALVQLVPAALFAPWVSGLADRRPAGHVLRLSYLVQATALAATGLVLASDGPALVAYALAAAASTAITTTRPTQAALLPALARRAEELVAANAVTNWLENASTLVLLPVAGVILAVSGPAAVFLSMAGLVVVSALLVWPLGSAGAQRRITRTGQLAEIFAGVRELRAEPAPRALVGLLGAEYVVFGALDVLFVVLAVSVLDIGGSGAGYLTAAFGAGGAVGIVATAALVRRARFACPLLIGAAVWSGTFVAIAIWPGTAAAFVLVALGGVAHSVFDVSGRTLLQRAAPAELIARVFGVLEGLSMAGLAVGSVLAPAVVALAGPRGAFAAIAVVLPVALALAWRALPAADSSTRPVVETALLRCVPMFALYEERELAALASKLEAVDVASGDTVIQLDETADRFYIVADGRLEVELANGGVRSLGPADAFGEVALLGTGRRTATVVAHSECVLYALDGDAFRAALARE